MIFIITVNYYQEKHLDNIYEIIEKRDDIHLTIVDNSKSIENIPDSRNIKHIVPDQNLGYLSGLCLGIEKEIHSSNDIIILCNPDILFNDQFFNRLKDLTDFNKLDLIAPSIINLSKKNQNPNKINNLSKSEVLIYDIEFFSFFSFVFIRFLKEKIKKVFLFFQRTKNNSSTNAPLEIFLPHGSCMIFKGAFFTKKPYFDYNVFLWGEEAIIADKVRSKGGKIKFRSELEVKHSDHSSTKHIDSYKKYKIWKKSYKIYRELLF